MASPSCTLGLFLAVTSASLAAGDCLACIPELLNLQLADIDHLSPAELAKLAAHGARPVGALMQDASQRIGAVLWGDDCQLQPKLHP